MIRKAVFILMLLLSGCAMFQKSGDRADQQQKLDQAVDMIRKGNGTAAGKILASLSREKGTAGITDEVLFRLGMLQLRSDRDLSASSLERLMKEYPSSPWAKTAAPVLDLMEQNEELRGQNRNLKGQNQNLAKENKELIQNIERIKNLDMQLERRQR